MVLCQGKLHLFVLEYLVCFDEVIEVLHENVRTLLATLEQLPIVEHEIVEEADIVESEAQGGACKVFIGWIDLGLEYLVQVVNFGHVDQFFVESKDLVILLRKQSIQRLQKLILKRLFIERKYLVEANTHELNIAESILLHIVSLCQAMHDHILKSHLSQPLL